MLGGHGVGQGKPGRSGCIGGKYDKETMHKNLKTKKKMGQDEGSIELLNEVLQM